MPKSKEYISSDSSSSEDEVSTKKRKKENKNKPSPKKSKKEEKLSSSENDNSWDIGQNRFVEIKDFKGKLYVDVREKYVDKNTADLKPGKKGIFLTTQQWRKMLEVANEVNEALSKM